MEEHIISIKNIQCSTATIVLDNNEYQVNYWYSRDSKRKYIQWVVHQGEAYQGKKLSQLGDKLFVFQAICDLYKKEFQELEHKI